MLINIIKLLNPLLPGHPVCLLTRRLITCTPVAPVAPVSPTEPLKPLTPVDPVAPTPPKHTLLLLENILTP